MMSASEGGGESWKSGHSKGGCVNFILYKSVPIADMGEGVKEPENLADIISGSSLTCSEKPIPFHIAILAGVQAGAQMGKLYPNTPALKYKQTPRKKEP